MSPAWASRTLSCCRWPSIRSAARGDTRCRRTSRQQRGLALPTISGTSWTGCIRPASASSLTGCPHTFRATTGHSPVSTARRCTSIPTRAAASSRTGVRNFLVANALYWLEEFHLDGLRVDAVASMLYLDYSRRDGEWSPNAYGGRENLDAISFLQETNATAYRRAPGVSMIAEESTAWPGVTRPTHLGGLGFGFKWNMGWMHDTLAYLSHDPVFRHYHHNELTFSLIYAFTENFVLPLSHDEVVHGKGSLLGKLPGDDWRRFAGLRGLLAYMWAHPGKQLLFMGSEFGQGAEWSEQRGLDWWVLDDDYHRGVQQLVRDLNTAYSATPALWRQDTSPAGFEWIDANDAGGNTLSFLRFAGAGGLLACIANMPPSPAKRRN